MTVMTIVTKVQADNKYGIDPALFQVERVLEHITTDDATAVTVQHKDQDGLFTQVFTDMPWSAVRANIVDLALITDEPIFIVIVFGTITNVQYGPYFEEGWVEDDEDDDDIDYSFLDS